MKGEYIYINVYIYVYRERGRWRYIYIYIHTYIHTYIQIFSTARNCGGGFISEMLVAKNGEKCVLH
jgi:hypothetical protein